jgi:hypothetical protein
MAHTPRTNALQDWIRSRLSTTPESAARIPAKNPLGTGIDIQPVAPNFWEKQELFSQ